MAKYDREFYHEGNPTDCDKIKRAFSNLGYWTEVFDFRNPKLIYYTVPNKGTVVCKKKEEVIDSLINNKLYHKLIIDYTDYDNDPNLEYITDMVKEEHNENELSNVAIIIPNDMLNDDVKAFGDECIEMIKLYAKKNNDYGNSFEKGIETIGYPYAIGRIYDKVNRLINLSIKGNVNKTEESVIDTIRDLACYAVMLNAYNTKAIKSETKQTNNTITFE